MRIRARWLLAALLTGAALCGCDATDPTDPALPLPADSPSAAPSAPTGPVIGAWHELVYHDRLGTTVLVNGAAEMGAPPDARLELWSWDGARWALLNRDGPSVRNFAAVAYDSDRDVLIVHGGIAPGGGGRFDETWEWDGQRWQQFAAEQPGGREGAVLAYYPDQQVTLLYGGSVDAEVRADTWAWDGASWRPVTEDGPPARFANFLVYDPARRNLVLYGGHVVVEDGPLAVADTWLWDSSGWREAAADSAPGPRVNARAVFDPGPQRVLLVAGGSEAATLDDVWGWDGTSWTRLAEHALPPRQAHGLAYDSTRQVVVLTGGLDQPGTAARHQDVWESAGTAFERVYPPG